MPDTIKFCRGCGLPLVPISGYIASAGLTPLTPVSQVPQSPKDQVLAAWYGLTAKQQMILSILFFVFLPSILGSFGKFPGLGGLFNALSTVAGIMIPVGIVYSVFRFKKCKAEQLERDAARAAITAQTFNTTLTQPMTGASPYEPPTATQELPRQSAGQSGSYSEDATQRLPAQPRARQ